MRASDWQSRRTYNVRQYGAVGDGSTDDTAAIVRAIIAATSQTSGGAREAIVVYVPAGQYRVTQTIEIPSGVSIYTDGRLVNYQVDKWSPTVKLLPGSSADKLLIWGNLGTGVLAGAAQTYCDVKIGELRLWNIGEEYDTVKGPKYGLKLRGYNYDIGQIQIDGGNIGIDLDGASDVRLTTGLLYTASTGIRITSGCEHIHFGYVMVDTPSYLGLQVDSSHDLELTVVVFINNNDQTSGLTYAIQIGEYSSGDNVNTMRLHAQVQNTGGTALRLSNARNCLIDLQASNETLGTGNSTPISTAISYGAGLVAPIRILLAKSSGITTYTGTQVGDIL